MMTHTVFIKINKTKQKNENIRNIKTKMFRFLFYSYQPQYHLIHPPFKRHQKNCKYANGSPRPSSNFPAVRRKIDYKKVSDLKAESVTSNVIRSLSLFWS